MAIKTNNLIPLFSSQLLRTVSDIIGDTSEGLTNKEIDFALGNLQIPDSITKAPPGFYNSINKRDRLYNALANFSNKYQCGNHVISLINYVMNPAQYTKDRSKFEERRSKLNAVLALEGYAVNESGKIVRSAKATTLKEAIERANRFKGKLEDRNTHSIIIECSLFEIISDNYFYTVLEAMKSISKRVRDLSGLEGDGVNLIESAFTVKQPLIKINSLKTDTEIGEQKGFIKLVSGLYGVVRNPLAHESKDDWDLSEQDALEIISTISYVHRKLDKAEGIK